MGISLVGLVCLIAIGIVCIIAAVHIYLLPAIIAYDRGHPQSQAILALNLLLGWCFLGWAAAMIWAWTNVPPAPKDLTYG
jgi:RsiW-degrading membrane proteinase PrsW (M82 family)